jgi:dihydrofolate synthase/folylpolyglutamate synthase
VFGTVNDKNIDNILSHLPKNACYYFCQADIARAMNAQELKNKGKVFNLNGDAFTSVKQAFNNAKECAKKDDLIFIGGSTFVVAEVL